MSDKITKSIIVKADVERAFNAWANFQNFPLFMEHIKAVQSTGDGKSRWVMKGPLGKDVEWNAEVTMLEMNKRIGWSTKDHHGDITTSGQVTFTQLGHQETQITVIMNYVNTAGVTGKIAEKLFANPEKQLEEDLENFKNHIEGMHDRTASAK